MDSLSIMCKDRLRVRFNIISFCFLLVLFCDYQPVLLFANEKPTLRGVMWAKNYFNLLNCSYQTTEPSFNNRWFGRVLTIFISLISTT